MTEQNRILVVGPAWVGDMVMAHSFFQLLAKQNNLIDVLAPAWSHPLLQRMPEINKIIESPFAHGELRLGDRYRLGKSLRGQYDSAIILPLSLKAALVPFFAKIKQRKGFLGEHRYGLINQRIPLDENRWPKMVDRYCALADAGFTDFPNPKLPVDLDNQAQLIETLQLNPDAGPILTLCPGAEYGPAKRWPASHYADLAQHYLQLGWQVYILGSKNDSDIADEINQLCHQTCLNLTGRTRLLDAIDLLALSQRVVCNDSGLMHIACAVDVPVYALFGSSDTRYTPPLSDKALGIESQLSCRPCFKRTCQFQHTDCLTKITPEIVIEKMEATHV